jgi:hypothetical protein
VGNDTTTRVPAQRLLDDVADLPPGHRGALLALREAVAFLTAASSTDLDGRDAAVVAAELASAVSRLTVAKVRTLPVIDSDGLWAISGARSFPVWLADRHGLPIAAARAQVRLGRTLRDHLPVTAVAAAAGEITLEHAQVLAQLAPTTPQRRDVLADPANECNEAFLVDLARQRCVDDLRMVLRHWAQATDPDADDRGFIESCDREFFDVAPVGNEYHVRGKLTLEHGQVFTAGLAAITPVPAVDDQRSASQRRAQAAADLAQLAVDHGLVGTGHAVRPQITVLVDEARFRALVEAALARPSQGTLVSAGPTRTPSYATAAMFTGDAPAGAPHFLDGTPVPRALLDKLACDSQINRVIFGPKSQVLDVGRAERTFTGPRRAAIIARDKHCRYPTCTAPPALSEAHHVDHWARDHGATSVDNGILLCWHHHSLVHRRGIEIHRRSGRWVFLDRHGLPIDPHQDIQWRELPAHHHDLP